MHPISITVFDEEIQKAVTVGTVRAYRNKQGKVGHMFSLFSNETEDSNNPYQLSLSRLELFINKLQDIRDGKAKPILTCFQNIPETTDLETENVE